MHQRLRAWLLNALLVAASVLAGASMIEGVIAYALSHPAVLESPDGSVGRALSLARNYYMRKDRRIVQFLPDCAVYDPQVTYTLKPGARCVVENREHRVEYAANRAGVRDGDDALERPAVVVAGDSFAMGWGVAAGESFPKLLQRDLGARVLDAAVSSYGTARELALIERLALPPFRALVIQYSDNDFGENAYLVEHGRLDILPEAQYRAVVAEHARDTRYYPFKYVRNLLSIARLAMPWRKPAPPEPDTNAAEARAFLEVLLRHASLLQGKTVLVLELNGNNLNDGRFVGAVTALLGDARYAALKNAVTTLDVSKALTAADYYVLDDHLRPQGHEKVARLIEDALKRRGFPAR